MCRSGLEETLEERRGDGHLRHHGIYRLENVTIVDNYAVEGGGIYASDSPIAIKNASLSGNFAEGDGGGIHSGGYTPSVYYCNAYENSPDNYYGFTDPSGMNGNDSLDPDFLDTTSPDPLEWDLHLSTASALIDAGDPAILDPDGSPSDIGAYGGPSAEFWDLDWDGYYEWWQPGEYDYGVYPGEGWDCDDQDDAVYPGNGC